ncbi:MAG: 2-hydroxyglutaryl-CoA dehydratase, partial [Deltaproteobacteria bacterium]
MANGKLYMGIDLGSVSLNIVVIDQEADIKASLYKRTEGRPLAALLNSFDEIGQEFDSFEGIVATGSGRKLLVNALGVSDINEIIAQGTGAAYFHPEVRTIIEIGGQDSKLIFLDKDSRTGEPVIIDHALNDVCAAGTGSFLDLQANRLGITIEDFGALALC